MVRLLEWVVAIGLAAVLLAPDVASAAGRHSGDRLSWRGSGYTVEEVAPSTPAALAGIRPGDRIIAIDGRGVNDHGDIDRETQRGGNRVVVDIERAGSHLRLSIAPRAITRFEATEYIARSQRVLGIVRTERRLVPGSGANDVYVPPPIPPEPPTPPPPMIVN